MAEVQAKMEQAANATQRRRWRIVYNALVDPDPAASIALHTCWVVCIMLPEGRLITHNRAETGPDDAGSQHSFRVRQLDAQEVRRSAPDECKTGRKPGPASLVELSTISRRST